MLKEITLEHHEGQLAKMHVSKIDFPFPLTFSKLRLIIVAKMAASVFYMYVGEY